MGVVHLAQGPDGRRVALKVLRPHVVGDREARERLAREVASLRRISSPRVAAILDADPHGPVPFVVTRYVPGLSLHHHVKEEGPIAGYDLLHFADLLAAALEDIHWVGVLHRDVKPTNVVMEGRSPVLIDFGLARVAEDARITQSGWLLGTPGYLAPEILYGDEATVASDVHAWAATVAFAATGRAPYGTGPAMAIMDRVRRGEVDLTGMEEPLAGLVREALSPEPLERPTVREIRARIYGTPSEEWTRPFVPEQVPASAPPTRILPMQSPPRPVRPPVLYPGPPPEASRAQRVGQLLGLAAVTAAAVAYAPYAGIAAIAVLVLVLRTASVTRQRHGRRRHLRGRPRWYDVPLSTLALPGYLLLALFGAVAVVAVAVLSGLALFSLGYLLDQPLTTNLLLAGVGFTPALWWGPGSGRVRETTRAMVTRTARSELGGWLVVVLSTLLTAALVGLLLTGGPQLGAGRERSAAVTARAEQNRRLMCTEVSNQ